MSTYYGLRNPMTQNEMLAIGVRFDDGMIVDNNNENYLHPQYVNDTEAMYGFTRYAGNNPEYLLEILDENGIDWMDEYDLQDCYPIFDIAEELGVELDDEGDLYDTLSEIVSENDWYTEEYYWAMQDDNTEEYIKEWCNEHKEDILSTLSQSTL
jgi:hypothetical protein